MPMYTAPVMGAQQEAHTTRQVFTGRPLGAKGPFIARGLTQLTNCSKSNSSGLLGRAESGTLLNDGVDAPSRLLLVEDNPDNQNLVLRILEKANYVVDVADNGQIAVEAVKNNTFDLVLMDVQMPVMDGFEASLAIRSWEQESGRARVPIVALTAHAIEGYRETCLKNGMDDYMTKPLRRKRLLALIEQWLQTAAVTSKEA